jgi:hypothetical protein
LKTKAKETIMSLLDSVRQTISDVAENVVDSTRQISAQTQLQLAAKKLQLERAKRIHELGKQTFSWYQSGSLQVGGAVPSDVTDACRQLEDIERQLADTERALEEARLEAAQKNQTPGSGATITVSATPVPDPASDPNAPVYAPPTYNQPPTGYAPPPAHTQPPGYAQPPYPPGAPQSPPHNQYPPPPPPSWNPPAPPSGHSTVVLPNDDPHAPGAGGPPRP